MHAHGERALGTLLADDMLVEGGMNHARCWSDTTKRRALRCRWRLLGGDLSAECDAFVADVDALSRD